MAALLASPPRAALLRNAPAPSTLFAVAHGAVVRIYDAAARAGAEDAPLLRGCRASSAKLVREFSLVSARAPPPRRRLAD
jgi:hypothetical protein